MATRIVPFAVVVWMSMFAVSILILRRTPSSYTGYALVSPGVYLAWKLRRFQHRIASRVVDSIQSAVAAALCRCTATEEVFDVRQSERSIARLFLSQCLSLFPTCRAAFQPGYA